MESLGEFIKYVRRERGLTQDEVAQRLSVVTPVVSRWENDKSIPDLTNLSKLCTILTISIDEINKRQLIEGSKTLPPENYDGVRLGKFLKKLRIKNGLSQSEVGEKLFVTGQTVSKWENGSVVTLDVLNELSKLYAISPDLLLSSEATEGEEVVKAPKTYKRLSRIMVATCTLLFVAVGIFLGFFIDKSIKLADAEQKLANTQEALIQSEQSRLEYIEKLEEIQGNLQNP